MTSKKPDKWYTVVGVYPDNWQKFCGHVSAFDAQQAKELVRNNPEIDYDLLIVGVFEGKLMAIDSGAIAGQQGSENDE